MPCGKALQVDYLKDVAAFYSILIFKKTQVSFIHDKVICISLKHLGIKK